MDTRKTKLHAQITKTKTKNSNVKLHGKKLRLPFRYFRQHQNGWRHFLYMSVGVWSQSYLNQGASTGHMIVCFKTKSYIVQDTISKKKKITEHGDLWTITRLVNEAVNAFWSERIISCYWSLKGYWLTYVYRPTNGARSISKKVWSCSIKKRIIKK